MYVENAGIIKPDLLNFVANGGSSVDICSGAFAAAYAVLNDDGTVKYYAWNIAPRVKAKIFNAVGEVLMTITPQGEKILGVNGTIKIDHENGPVFEVEEGVIVLATYASGPYIGQPAVVVDGKQILSGPHWELNIVTNADGSSVPQYPDQFLNMIIAAYEGGNNVVDVNDLDNVVSVKIMQSDFKLMNDGVADYEREYPGKLFAEVYIRQDGIKQTKYVTRSKYYSLLAIWNAFIKANDRQPNYIYINSPTTPKPTPPPAPAGYVRVAPFDYYNQFNDYVCGDASWMMALSCFDIYPLNNSEQDCLNDPQAAELIIAGISGTQMNPNGTSHAGMLAVASHYGLQAEFVSFAGLGIQGLADAIAAGKVPIVNILLSNGTDWSFPQYIIEDLDEGHYIFVIGVDVATQTITVGDPDRPENGIETIPYSQVAMGSSLLSSPSLLLIWK